MAKKENIRKTVQKEMPEFADEVDAASVDALETRLARLAKDLEVTDEAQKNDTDLERAQALTKELAAPYKDAKKAIKLKTKYIISAIRDKGGNV